MTEWIAWMFSWIWSLTTGQIVGMVLFFCTFGIGHWFGYWINTKPRNRYGFIQVGSYGGYIVHQLKQLWATIVTGCILAVSVYLVLRDVDFASL